MPEMEAKAANADTNHHDLCPAMKEAAYVISARDHARHALGSAMDQERRIAKNITSQATASMKLRAMNSLSGPLNSVHSG